MHRILVPALLLALAACSGYVSWGWGYDPDYPWCCGYPYDYATWSAQTGRWPDVVVANDVGEVYRVPFAPAAGFDDTPELVADVGDGPRLVEAGDVDGDGRADVVLVEPTTGTVTTYLGDGVGGAAVAPAGTTILPVTTEIRQIRLAKLDADARADLVVREIDGTLQALHSVGDGSFVAETPLIETLAAEAAEPSGGLLPATVHVLVGSFDTNAGLDLVILNAVSRRIVLLSGVGDGTFEPRDAADIDLPGAVVHDVAGLPSPVGLETNLVVLVGDAPDGPARVVRYDNVDGGRFHRVDVLPAGGARRVLPFQLDGDAYPDLLLLDPDAGRIRVLRTETR